MRESDNRERATAVLGVPYDRLPGFSQTWQSVVAHDEVAASLFARAAGDLTACRDAMAGALARSRPWKQLADVLDEQGRYYRIPEQTLSRLSLVAEGKAVAVVTGQQVGYLGGPFYTFLKAYHCTRLARALEASLRAPVIPIFWLEGEDHDLQEVRESHYLLDSGELRSVRFTPQEEVKGFEVGRYRTGDQAVRHVHELATALGSVDGCATEILEHAYADTDLSSGMGRLLGSLLGDRGLLIVEGMHLALKRMARPLWERVIGAGDRMSKLLESQSAELKRSGRPTPLAPTADSFLFYLVGDDHVRVPMGYDGTFLKPGGETLSAAQLLQRVEQGELTISPKAALRPIYQDFVLPTIAYVAGPTELEYHAQLAPFYRELDVVPPSLFPRMTATVIEAGVSRTIKKLELSLEDLLAKPEHELRKSVLHEEDEGETGRAFGEARSAVESVFASLKQQLESVDPTLVGAAESAAGKALHTLKGLEQKSEKALKQTHSVVLNRLERVLTVMRPGGVPAERALGTAHYLMKFGAHSLLDALDRASADGQTHQWITLDT